jgi:RHS repeat-associated protein
VRSRGDVANRFLFTGEEQDPTTKLYYLRARWYDPKVGRFLTKDPFAGVAVLPLGTNTYLYALNNPINVIDPSGEFSFKRAFKRVVSTVKSAAQSDVGRFVIRTGLEAGITAGLSALGVPPPLAGFVGGAVSQFTDRIISGRPITLKHVLLQDVVAGGLIGASNAGFTQAVLGSTSVLKAYTSPRFIDYLAVKTFFGAFFPDPQTLAYLPGDPPPKFPLVGRIFMSLLSKPPTFTTSQQNPLTFTSTPSGGAK